MTTVSPRAAEELRLHFDQRITLRGLGWADYERLLAVRGDKAIPRMTFLEGELELMSPSWDHEWIKKCLARLVEAYAEERCLDLNGIGSWTVRSELQERGLEPDECYVLGERVGKDRPDLAIEVNWTAGGIAKLEVHRGLGVPEVWIWQGGRIEVHLLRGDTYERSPTSALLPGLDLEILARFLDGKSQGEAVRGFRAWLRERS